MARVLLTLMLITTLIIVIGLVVGAVALMPD
jgi:hypothetical protein